MQASGASSGGGPSYLTRGRANGAPPGSGLDSFAVDSDSDAGGGQAVASRPPAKRRKRKNTLFDDDEDYEDEVL